MPTFFPFQTGDSTRGPATESSPLLGRFRAVPSSARARSHSFGLNRRRSLVWGYEGSEDGESEDEDEEEIGRVGKVGKVVRRVRRRTRRLARLMRDLWVEPKQGVVARAVDRWWWRWVVLGGLPAFLAVAWCAIPFPQYELPDDDDVDVLRRFAPSIAGHKVPGHGEARVEINFWFFLFVYYGLYNLTALMWITKVFNIYSLNWWPQSLGFPFTISVIAVVSVLAPIPVYYIPESRFFTHYNTTWICWTFFAMTMPLIIAFTILLNHERHLGLRHSLSETQRIFTSSWWTGDSDTLAARERARRPPVQQGAFDPDAPLEVALATDDRLSRQRDMALRKRWIPASFIRFIWFCVALFIGMAAYVLGEAYAEIYLRTLPHNTMDTILYVYSWVITVHLLDGLVGWILGGNEGERVGSYPLGWIFKLYFSLTYQTYVRALYARLRSYQQFITLQVLSSSFLIILAPLTISAPFHYILTLLGINGQSLPAYQKFCARNIFIRNIAENVSMLAFLGSILVLHYGSNKDVYPYFAFDRVRMPDDSTDGGAGNPWEGGGDDYDFGRTFYASVVTWACEIVAGWVVRRILWFGWEVDVTGEGKRDLGSWPELLPTGVVVMVHVLQNMLFSIVRLRFH